MSHSPVAEVPHEVSQSQDGTPTDDVESLRERIALLDAQLAATEQENVRLETQHAKLSASFAQVQRELAELSTSSKFISAAKEAVDAELAEERRKREAAEELVEHLRAKVDDARKAFGALQKQDKRASMMLSPADAPSLDVLGFGSVDDTAKPRTSKRTSILFGSAGARRPSNASDIDHPDANTLLLSPPQISSATTPTPTPTLPQAPVNAKGLRELRLSSAPGASAVTGGAPPSPSAAAGAVALDVIPDGTSKRWSGMSFGTTPRSTLARKPVQDDAVKPDAIESQLEEDSKRHSRPSPGDHRSSSASEVDLSLSPPVAQADRSDALTLEIAQLHAQLRESQEARVASEACLKALREFIASSNGGSTGPTEGAAIAAEERGLGLAGIKLPPLPTDRDVEEEDHIIRTPQQDKKFSGTGWGLGLWRAAASGNPVVNPAAPQSVTTSTRSEAGDARSATPSAIQSPETQHDKQLPGTGEPEPAMNPLRNFVSSWSKAVPAGTPKTETPPGAPSPAGTKKGFSFFTRSTSDRDVSVAAEEVVPPEAFVPKDVTVPKEAKMKPDVV
ncbi:hypothetical protein NCC49_002181 [Naganishia albida]|nr:hypothetical protein NCC49_002181 [Naganishia albida]